jgi:type IV secretory pathway TraG/TraD family ATPase VirD4
VKRIPADQWSIFSGEWRRLPAIGVISKAGGGKDEGLVGPTTYQELVRGLADLIVMDPKLEQLGAALRYGYMPENADVYVYGTSPRLDPSHTDAFDLFALRSNLSTARIITEEKSQDTHWQHKAAELLVVAHAALEEMTGERVALDYVREVIADREALAELRKESSAVSNVADEEKEWGYIRSTAKKALEPLESERVKGLFGSEGVRMPDFTSPRRQIVFLCPDSGAGDEEAKLTAAMVDVLVQLGRASGPERVQKFLMNEAGSFMSLPKLPHYVDIGRGESIYMMYVLQSWSQLVNRLGTAGARNLWSGSAAQIVGQGAEPELAEEMCGYADPVRRRHRQPRQLRDAPGGERVAEERRPGLQPHHVTGLGINEWVMRVAPEIYRFKVALRNTQTEQLKKLKRGGRR